MVKHKYKGMKTHGESNWKAGKRSPTYTTWSQMKQRCTNPNNPRWEHYGGKGIKVCTRWLTYENFLADMGPRPPGLTIDRFPNRNGNYEPGNCRWATSSEQRINQNRYMFNDQKLITPIDKTTKEALRAAAESIKMPMAELVRLAITYATADRHTLTTVIQTARVIQTTRQLKNA